MTLHDSILMFEKLHRQFEIQNSIGSLALEKYNAINAIHDAIPKPFIQEYALSQSLLEKSAAEQALVEQYALKSAAFEQQLTALETGLSSGILGAVKTIGMLSEVIAPYAIRAVQASIGIAQAIQPYAVAANRIMGEIGVEIAPLIREFHDNITAWDAQRLSGLASSVGAMALDYHIDDFDLDDDYATEEQDKIEAGQIVKSSATLRRKELQRGKPTKAFARAIVNQVQNQLEILIFDRSEIRTLGIEEPQQAVDVFIGWALPRRMGVGKEDSRL